MYSMVSISMIKFWEYLARKKSVRKIIHKRSNITRSSKTESFGEGIYIEFFSFSFFFFSFFPSTIFYILIAYLHAKLILSRYNITNA